MQTGFLGPGHPGKSVAFWDHACRSGQPGGCASLIYRLRVDCLTGNSKSCVALGQHLESGEVTAVDRVGGSKVFAQACFNGHAPAWDEIRNFLNRGGISLLIAVCHRGDGVACHIAGSVCTRSAVTAKDRQIGVDLLGKACAQRVLRGCHELGEWFRSDQNFTAAINSYELACGGNYALSCLAVSALYESGVAGTLAKNLGRERRRRACTLGLITACDSGDAQVAFGHRD